MGASIRPNGSPWIETGRLELYPPSGQVEPASFLQGLSRGETCSVGGAVGLEAK